MAQYCYYKSSSSSSTRVRWINLNSTAFRKVKVNNGNISTLYSYSSVSVTVPMTVTSQVISDGWINDYTWCFRYCISTWERNGPYTPEYGSFTTTGQQFSESGTFETIAGAYTRSMTITWLERNTTRYCSTGPVWEYLGSMNKRNRATYGYGEKNIGKFSLSLDIPHDPPYAQSDIDSGTRRITGYLYQNVSVNGYAWTKTGTQVSKNPYWQNYWSTNQEIKSRSNASYTTVTGYNSNVYEMMLMGTY